MIKLSANGSISFKYFVIYINIAIISCETQAFSNLCRLIKTFDTTSKLNFDHK